jgi:hypothetical protein
LLTLIYFYGLYVFFLFALALLWFAIVSLMRPTKRDGSPSPSTEPPRPPHGSLRAAEVERLRAAVIHARAERAKVSRDAANEGRELSDSEKLTVSQLTSLIKKMRARVGELEWNKPGSGGA